MAMATAAVTRSERISMSEAARIDEQLAEASAEEVLAWGLQTFGKRLVIASSFGAEDVVLVDLVARIDTSARIFTLDTGRLPQETYDVMDRLRVRYGIEFEVMMPDQKALEAL